MATGSAHVEVTDSFVLNNEASSGAGLYLAGSVKFSGVNLGLAYNRAGTPSPVSCRVDDVGEKNSFLTMCLCLVFQACLEELCTPPRLLGLH